MTQFTSPRPAGAPRRRSLWIALALIAGVALGADESPGSWRQWGGPGGEFQVPTEGLADSWGENGPPVLWSRELGKGYAAITADGGALYTMYRDGDDEIAVALRAHDGRGLWEHRYAAPPSDRHVVQFGKGPNASPLVLDDQIITYGYTGVLSALSRKTGAVQWTHRVIEEYGGEVLEFGTAASPILHEGKVIVLVGGERQGAMAFDAVDGSVVWKSTPSTVSYSTPRVIDVDGQEQIIYFSAEEILAIDPGTGLRLWNHPVVNRYRNNCTNIIWGKNHLLWAATQLDGGTRVLKLSQKKGTTTVKEIWQSDEVSIHFWNALRLDNHVYASIGGQATILAAVDIRTGKIAWRERGYRQVNFVHTGEHTVFLDADGKLVLARLSPNGLEVKARANLPSDETWTAPTLVGTTMYVRDQTWIRALDLGKPAAQ